MADQTTTPSTVEEQQRNQIQKQINDSMQSLLPLLVQVQSETVSAESFEALAVRCFTMGASKAPLCGLNISYCTEDQP